MKNKKKIGMTGHFEILEKRYALTAISFVAHELSPRDTSPEHFIPFDLDNDGDIDVVSDFGDELVWFENTDGLGTFSDPLAISARYGVNFELADLNGNGNADLLSGAKWLPGNGDGTFGSLASMPVGAERSYSVDLDSDGDLDVLAVDTENATVHWLENSDGLGSFSLRDSVQLPSFETLLFADLNGDALVDVIFPNDDGAIWFPNSSDDGPFNMQLSLELAPDRLEKLLAADWDRDGDTDLISLSNPGKEGLILWHENDASGVFGQSNELLRADQAGPIDIHLVDIEQDGDLDIMYEYNHFDIPGLGDTSLVENLTVDMAHEITDRLLFPIDSYLGDVAWADLNGDDNLDTIFTGSSRGLTYMNNDPALRSPPGYPFVGISQPVQGQRVGLEDVDGDSVNDIVWNNRDLTQMGWFPGKDDGTFGDSQDIETPTSLPFVDDRIYVDIDNDGDLDVVDPYGGFVWYERVEDTYTKRAIDSVVGEPSRYQVVDQDGDGDVDLIAISWLPDEQKSRIMWLENVDGNGNFELEQTVAEVETSRWFYSVDFDLDGDFDILTGTSRNLDWFEYHQATSTFLEAPSANDLMPRELILADADGNGLADHVVGLNVERIVLQRELAVEMPLMPRYAGSMAVDLDVDGDLDVVIATGERLRWRENVDGRLERHVGTASSVGLLIEDMDAGRWSFGDVDNDGDLDVISAGLGKVRWYENRLVGDTNDDGVVDFHDFLTLSANFGAVDAVWKYGDFTGDGMVSFEDFLALSANFNRSRVARD